MAAALPAGFGPAITAPTLSANVALAGMEVFVDLADLIDVGAEIERKRQREASYRRVHQREAQEAGERKLCLTRPSRGGARRASCLERS